MKLNKQQIQLLTWKQLVAEMGVARDLARLAMDEQRWQDASEWAAQAQFCREALELV